MADRTATGPGLAVNAWRRGSGLLNMVSHSHGIDPALEKKSPVVSGCCQKSNQTVSTSYGCN